MNNRLKNTALASLIVTSCILTSAFIGLSAHPADTARMREQVRLEYEMKYTAERNYAQMMNIYELVQAWAQDAWEKARKTGKVTDEMLQPYVVKAHWIAGGKGKKKVSPTVAAETAV